MQKQKNKERGITLVALVVTIIVLIILASVSIAMLVGENGIITQAQRAAQETEIKGDEEKIRLAMAAAQIASNGSSNIEKDDLEIALLENGTKSIVVDKEDGTRNIIFLDSKKIYKLNSDDSIEDTNSDFDSIYVAPDSQDDARNEGVIGIGTDGQPVDMDLWEYTLLEDEELGKVGTYGLNDKEALDSSGDSGRSAGYLGGYTEEGKIIGTIPAYISMDNGNTYTEVTSLAHTFYDCDSLVIAPEIPSTTINMGVTFYMCSKLTTASDVPGLVTHMEYTFSDCEQLKSMPKIGEKVEVFDGTFQHCVTLTTITPLPNNITSMRGTFLGCLALEVAPEIPINVIKLNNTFQGCTSLQKAPSIIPDKVDNMQSTFQGCTSLITPPSLIPASIKNLRYTFSDCQKISGTIRIDAEPEVYDNCFGSAATSPGAQLIVIGNSSILDDIINTKSTNSNIIYE